MRSTDRTRIRRHAERARTDRAVLEAILDEAIVCHVGFDGGRGPVVIPTLHVRLGDDIVIHGSPATGMIRALRDGAPACLTVTLLDGLVVSRSAFGHAVNYRSAVLFGSFAPIEDPDRAREAARAIVERILPGRWEEARPPTDAEMRATAFLAMPIDEASVKVREGFPLDGEDDKAGEVWAGQLPLHLVPGDPIPDPGHGDRLPVPPSVRRRAERGR